MPVNDRNVPAAVSLTSAFLLADVAAKEVDHGYAFNVRYTGEVVANVSGGLDTGARYLDNLDLMLEVDVAEALGNGKGTIFLHALYNNGSTFADELVGDLQVTSNIDAPEALRVYEAWYEFGDGSWSVKAGLYDLNSEFDVNETGSLFLNSSHGIGPAISQTGRNGPSIFPISSLALRADWKSDRVVTRLVVLDGVPGDPDDPSSNEIDLGGDDGALIVAEAELPFSTGRAWGGVWRYTADFERPFASGRDNGNDGWYLGIERGFRLGERAASAFLRYGRANDDLNPIEDYLGAGIVVEGPLADRPEDQLGFALASAGVGAPYRAFLRRSGTAADSRETTWELTYRAPVTEHVALQPNLQYVQSPSADASIGNALVLGIRFELSY